MDILYGDGFYSEKQKKINGKIILGDHKLYLKGTQGDFPETYIPLEKIQRLRLILQGLQVSVRVSPTMSYQAVLMGERKNLSELTQEIVGRRNLRKQFLRPEWIEKEE